MLALIDRAIVLKPAVPDFFLTRSFVFERTREWDRAIESAHSTLPVAQGISPLLKEKAYANERLAYLAAWKKRHSAG